MTNMLLFNHCNMLKLLVFEKGGIRNIVIQTSQKLNIDFKNLVFFVQNSRSSTNKPSSDMSSQTFAQIHFLSYDL